MVSVVGSTLTAGNFIICWNFTKTLRLKILIWSYREKLDYFRQRSTDCLRELLIPEINRDLVNENISDDTVSLTKWRFP